MAARIDELAAKTSVTRDRYVDFLRGTSILVVVFGHWFIGQVYWQDGIIGTTSAIGKVSWAWALTWVLMVMPIFFFVGGFSNLVTYRSYRRKGESTLSWLRSRFARLLKPTLVFIGVWVVIQVVLHLTNTGGQSAFLRGMNPPGATVPFGPLWFLLVYMLVILIAPAFIRLHDRFGVAVPVVMVVGAVAADVVGFVVGISGVRYANVLFVWLLPHQLGFFYADGRLTALPRRTLAAMAAVGLGALILLTNPWVFGEAGQRWFPGIGHYPKSLMGTDLERISNMWPPTICLVAMSLWSIGAVMLVREPISRWLQRTGPWKATILVNSVIMTLFLWHMTAYLVVILVLWPLGFGQTNATALRWWIERPLWLILPGIILVGLVAVFGRFERRATPVKAPAAARPAA